MDFVVNSIESEFVIERLLGEGGCAVIFAMRSIATQEVYAAKLLPAYNALLRTQSLKELIIWRDCSQHENIIDLHAVYENNLGFHSLLLQRFNQRRASQRLGLFPAGDYYIALMPIMAGGDLFDYATKTRVDEETVCVIAEQLASASTFMHSLGWAHCDLKLENVLLERHPSQGIIIRICDFGFARAFDDELPACGPQYTVAYAAPEILASLTTRAKYGSACDMWAIGVMLFTIYAQHYPFEGLQTEAGYKNHATFTPHHRKCLAAGSYSFEASGFQRASTFALAAISALLKVESSARLTAKQLLEHEWLSEPIRVPFFLIE
jgi:serine/threonine protein kinase